MTAAGPTPRFMYNLGWGPRLIDSRLFHDGGAHVNSIRDPLPSRVLVPAAGVHAGEYHIAADILTHAVPVMPIAVFPDAELARFAVSAAARTHRFTYSGNGVFFTPSLHSPPHFLRQDGCTLGDIRVSFHVFAAAAPATMIGKVGHGAVLLAFRALGMLGDNDSPAPPSAAANAHDTDAAGWYRARARSATTADAIAVHAHKELTIGRVHAGDVSLNDMLHAAHVDNLTPFIDAVRQARCIAALVVPLVLALGIAYCVEPYAFGATRYAARGAQQKLHLRAHAHIHSRITRLHSSCMHTYLYLSVSLSFSFHLFCFF